MPGCVTWLPRSIASSCRCMSSHPTCPVSPVMCHVSCVVCPVSRSKQDDILVGMRLQAEPLSQIRRFGESCYHQCSVLDSVRFALFSRLRVHSSCFSLLCSVFVPSTRVRTLSVLRSSPCSIAHFGSSTTPSRRPVRLPTLLSVSSSLCASSSSMLPSRTTTAHGNNWL